MDGFNAESSCTIKTYKKTTEQNKYNYQLNMKNPLSDIYANQILLNEDKKSNVVVPSGKMEIAKGDKVSPTKDTADSKVKKDVETPEENAKYSDGKNAQKKVEENMTTNDTIKAYEGAFEKLFKATINEEFDAPVSDEMSPEVPTETEDMVDEIGDEKDEVSDLVSDLKAVMGHLQGILDKLSGGEEESTEEESAEEEAGESESAESEPFEEAVKAEVKGHALHNLKAGTDLMSKGKKEVKGAVPVSKGKATTGDVCAEPELKELGKTEELHNPKKKPEPKSSVKVGDFFK